LRARKTNNIIIFIFKFLFQFFTWKYWVPTHPQACSINPEEELSRNSTILGIFKLKRKLHREDVCHPIISAIKQNHAKCLNWYLKHKFNAFGDKLLQFVFEKVMIEQNIQDISIEIFQVLIDNHIPLDTGTFEGIQDKTAYVKFAIRMKNINLLELLLTKNVPLQDFEVLSKACYFEDHTLQYYPLPPLFYAVDKCKDSFDLTMIEMLLQYGAKLNFQDQVNLPQDTLSKLNIVFHLVHVWEYTLEGFSLFINLFCKLGLKIVYENSDGSTDTRTITVLRTLAENYQIRNELQNAAQVSDYADFLEYKTKKKSKIIG
jgi:hypothetical protein